jgi:hypothetical protein
MGFGGFGTSLGIGSGGEKHLKVGRRVQTPAKGRHLMLVVTDPPPLFSDA